MRPFEPLKRGDRVVYVGTGWPALVGKAGTVRQVFADGRLWVLFAPGPLITVERRELNPEEKAP